MVFGVAPQYPRVSPWARGTECEVRASVHMDVRCGTHSRETAERSERLSSLGLCGGMLPQGNPQRQGLSPGRQMEATALVSLPGQEQCGS